MRTRRKAEQPSNHGGSTSQQGDWKVERVASDQGAKLFEFGPVWHGWAYPDKLGEPLPNSLIKGGIAKVTPPAGTPLSTVDAVERYLYACGVVAVRIMPSGPDDRVQVEPQAERSSQGIRKRSLRQVAVERAERVAEPRDRQALVDRVNEAMDHGEGKA